MNPERTYFKNGQIRTETCRNEAGKFHQLDGPASQYWYNSGQLWSESWFINGKRHRLDGPARQSWYSNGQLDRKEYWIHGIEYETEAEFQVAVDLYKANEIAELF